MDKRLSDEVLADTIEWGLGFLRGYTVAIERLRENKYYGHYADGLADWLELHMKEEVKEPTSTNLRGKING